MGNVNKVLSHTCTPETTFSKIDFDLEELKKKILGNQKLTFDDRYEIDESCPIGTGMFSQVFLCWARGEPEHRYALKVINTPADDRATLSRIYDEISILRTLGNHSNIIHLVDVDEMEDSNGIRLVTELCEGGELYNRIEQKQYYYEMEAKILVCNLLEAVTYIHSKGIMHRDLKPENILLVSKDCDTDIKISDFGLAKMSKDYPNRLPRSASICGSDFYLAPEVVRQEEYGREVDIWAVGVITYSLLSGALPFHHPVLHKLYRQIMERDVCFSEPHWNKVSKGAQDFILRLIQLRAGDRLTAEQALNHPWLRSAATPTNSANRDSFAKSSPNEQCFGCPSPQLGDSQNHYLQNPETPRTPYKKNNSPQGQQPREPNSPMNFGNRNSFATSDTSQNSSEPVRNNYYASLGA